MSYGIAYFDDRCVIIHNLLESENQRKSSRRYGQETLSLLHLVEKMSAYKKDLCHILGLDSNIFDKLEKQVCYLTQGFVTALDNLKVKDKSGKKTIIEELNPKYAWLSIADNELSPENVINMFSNIMALREHRHGYAHQDRSSIGYKGSKIIHPIDEEGVDNILRAIFDVLNFVNNEIFKPLADTTW